MASRSWVLAVCVWIAGCGGGCGGAGSPPADDPPDDRAGSQGAGENTPVEAAEPPVEPGPRPVLRVVGEPDPHSASVTLRIENHGDEAAELTGAVVLERRAGDAWQPVEGVSLGLRYSCEDAAPECVTLAPGAIYLPPPWLGVVGDAQCDCQQCGPAPAGDYRFVVQSCSRAHTIEGESFTIAAD